MNPGIELLAAVAMGYIMQRARAYKSVNNWLTWGGVALAAAGLWVWQTPNALHLVQSNWRDSIASVVVFAMAGKGGGSMLKDAKAAPPTDSK